MRVWGSRNVPLRSDIANQSVHRQAGLATLYESHFERVARYIAVRIGDVGEAEDLASEVFLRALRSLDSYQDTGAPMEAWIFRIAHNIVVDHLRKKTRRPASVPLEEAFSVRGDEDPTRGVESQQEVQRLHAAMEGLSEDQRQVLALRFAGEMTSEHVAQIMGKKPGAVREMQSAAIKKLRKLLAEE